MKKLLVVLLLLPVVALGQKDKAIEQIRQMKDGVLLVRLMTKEKAITALEDLGRFEQAEQVKRQQREENQEIADAFRDSFTFCPIFFFYSNCSKNIREGKFEGCLLDATLNPVAETPEIGHYFISEFWHVERNDDKYYQDYSLMDDTAGNKTRQNLYYGDTELGPDALIIRDSGFVQLRHPFPFYVRTYEGFPILRRKKPKAVEKLDAGLIEFYNKVVNK